MENTIKKTAIEVIETEAQALHKLSEKLPKDFEKVVELIKTLPGNIIISGIGKSGHIGKKISATLSSTGTPSYFVHPTEASHGDLGSISKKDACILISNSGETTELRDLVAHTKRFSIPLIAISSKLNSTLMNAADYKLDLPREPEACNIGLAPTTSTTLTLALGDALAVTLMKEKQFNSEHFQTLHPGGKLGAQLIKVQDIMHKDEKIPTVGKNTLMPKTLLEMTSKGFGIAAVTSKGTLIGVISDGDLRRHMNNLLQKNAGQIATKDPITINQDSLADVALAKMNKKKINVIIAVDHKNKPVGILHIHDCVRRGL